MQTVFVIISMVFSEDESMASFMRASVLVLASAVLGVATGCPGGLEQADAPSPTPPGATMVDPNQGGPTVPGGPQATPTTPAPGSAP